MGTGCNMEVKLICTVFPHIRPAGIIFFTSPSTAGIIRMRVLIEGWYYYQIQRHLHTYYV